ncbi:hypothetical protein BG003_002006 [Podila horticola]|nr:hypothetical protein BG003_002006 [Podila horticola]
MAKAPHKSGFYFAQQFSFNNVTIIGYTGLQPREDKNGASIVHAAFSSFQGGTTTKHPNCYLGADNGPGVSCAVDINGDYSHTYNLVVENTEGTTWRGTMVDTVMGNATVVGEWTLPEGARKIVNGQVGFVEYYTWNGQRSHTCESLPFTEAIFYNPTSKPPAPLGIDWKSDRFSAGGWTTSHSLSTLPTICTRATSTLASSSSSNSSRAPAMLVSTPRPDSTGASIVHAVFSSLIDGTTTSGSNCKRGGPNGGPGVSYVVDFEGEYSHTYSLMFEHINGTTWKCTLMDSDMGVRVHVGI